LLLLFEQFDFADCFGVFFLVKVLLDIFRPLIKG